MSHLLVSHRRTRGGLGECNRQYFFGGKFVCKGPFIIYGGGGGGWMRNWRNLRFFQMNNNNIIIIINIYIAHKPRLF